MKTLTPWQNRFRCSQHRVVLGAVFQGGDRPQLTAAIPTFIPCCCDGFLCPG